uniref:Uncharacterized protein n=1 Tax=Myotis myotis TaxID=51298 RepID=A0A7J7QWV5_MYOMY|nr:hypothetical protein mMyoMyo1_011282 [Myotis myotis]
MPARPQLCKRPSGSLRDRAPLSASPRSPAARPPAQTAAGSICLRPHSSAPKENIVNSAAFGLIRQTCPPPAQGPRVPASVPPTSVHRAPQTFRSAPPPLGAAGFSGPWGLSLGSPFRVDGVWLVPGGDGDTVHGPRSVLCTRGGDGPDRGRGQDSPLSSAQTEAVAGGVGLWSPGRAVPLCFAELH